MDWLLAAVANGMIAGAIYSLMAIGFVVTYKTMRVLNFALSEFIVYGAGLAGLGYRALDLGLAGAIGFSMAGMALLGIVFNRAVFLRLGSARPLPMIMVTIGLGDAMRGAAPLLLHGVAPVLPLPLTGRMVSVGEVPFPLDSILVGVAALMAAAVAGAFFARTRLGLALRALAEQPAVAHAMGIDARRYFELAWVLAGIIAVVGGVLWSALRGPGFGLAVVSLKVFPIVIIGGLDSLAGAFAGGLAVGVLESLAATYLDVWVGGGFSTIASFLLLIPVLVLRPQGMFGTEQVERV